MIPQAFSPPRFPPACACPWRLFRLYQLLALSPLATRSALAAATQRSTADWHREARRRTVHTIMVLHNDGDRIAGKVYPNSSGATIENVREEDADTLFAISWGWNCRVGLGAQPIDVIALVVHQDMAFAADGLLVEDRFNIVADADCICAIRSAAAD